MSQVNKPVEVRQIPDYLAAAIEKLREESEQLGVAKGSLPTYVAGQAKAANGAFAAFVAAVWRLVDERELRAFKEGYNTANGEETR